MKIGIIGTGSIVESFINATKQIDGISIIAIMSRAKEGKRVKYLSEHYSIKYIYDNIDDMLLNTDINFIYVASPNSLHFEQSLKSLEAGKNVICEKPFTSTKKEAEILYETAKKRNLLIFEAILNIHLPNYRLIKDLLNKIGPIKIVQLNYSQYSSKYDSFLQGKNPNVFNPEYSGGALQDINVYNVHFMTYLFGFPKDAKYYPNITNNIDTSGIMIMDYNNFKASLIGAKDTKSNNFVYIQGENGYIYIPNGSNGCTEIILSLSEDNNKISINKQYENSILYYEIKEFKNIYETKNIKQWEKLIIHSINVVEFIERTRKDAGIIFTADKL